MGFPWATVAMMGVSALTSSLSQSNQNKNAKAQARAANKAAQKQYEFTWGKGKELGGEMGKQYAYQQAAKELQQGQLDQARQYQEQLQEDDYKKAIAIQKQKFIDDVAAFEESEKDYNKATRFNRQQSRLANRESRQTLEDIKTEQMFNRTQDAIDYGDQLNKSALRLSSASNSYNVNFRRRQAADKQAQQQFAAAENRFGTEQLRIAESERQANVDRNFGRREINQLKLSQEQDRDYNLDVIEDREALQLLTSNQQKDQLNRDLGMKKLATNQQKDALNARADMQKINASQQTDSIKDKLEYQKNTRDEITNQTRLGTKGAELSRTQTNANLDDREKYLKLAGESEKADLEDQLSFAEFDRDVAIRELTASKQQNEYEFDRIKAVAAFQREASIVEGLIGAGQAQARGVRGRSAERTVASILAAAGRQQAKITNDILHAGNSYRLTERTLDQKIEDQNNLYDKKEKQVTRKKSDITKRRGYEGATLKLGKEQSKATYEQAKSEFDLRDSAGGRLLDLQKATNKRELGDVTEIREQQQKDIDREKGDLDETFKLVEEDITARKGDIDERFAHDQKVNKRERGRARQVFSQQTAARNLKSDRLDETLTRSLRTTGLAKRQNKATLSEARQLRNYRNKTNLLNLTDQYNTYQTTAKEINNNITTFESNQQLAEAQRVESLLSAQKAMKYQRQRNKFDRYAADVAADARRLVKPMEPPALTAPYELPETTLLDPMVPEKPPAPKKAKASISSPWAAGLTSAANTIVAGIQAGVFNTPNKPTP